MTASNPVPLVWHHAAFLLPFLLVGTMREDALKAQVDALEQLLEVYESTSIQHAAKLERTMAELDAKTQLLVRAEQQQTELARKQASELREQFELGAAYQRELEEKLAMIEQQRAAIRELSTP